MDEETLEEAAKKRVPTSASVWDLTETRRNDFIAGAKWQQEQDNKELGMWKLAVEKQEARCKALNSVISDLQERMYSEEDLRNVYRWGTSVNHGTKEHFNEWFNTI